MLDLPSKGFLRSVNVHNVELPAMCDWIEASVLFSEANISQRDVVDVLVEKQIYEEQDFAQQRVNDAWVVLRQRAKLLGKSSPYKFEKLSIARVGRPWFDNSSYAFLVTLSLADIYPKWAKGFGPNFGPQGELFEKLLEHSLRTQFPGWSVLRTGWSTSTPVLLKSIVEEISRKLDESVGNVQKWTTAKQKEAGLDILLWRPFDDLKGSYPVYLFQCASGGGWDQKLHTPDLKIWTRVIDFRSRGHPTKAFATPFVLDQDEFTRIVNRVDGLLLDRMRISAASSKNRGWMPSTLARDIRRWGIARTRTLPTYD